MTPGNASSHTSFLHGLLVEIPRCTEADRVERNSGTRAFSHWVPMELPYPSAMPADGIYFGFQNTLSFVSNRAILNGLPIPVVSKIYCEVYWWALIQHSVPFAIDATIFPFVIYNADSRISGTFDFVDKVGVSSQRCCALGTKNVTCRIREITDDIKWWLMCTSTPFREEYLSQQMTENITHRMKQLQVCCASC